MHLNLIEVKVKIFSLVCLVVHRFLIGPILLMEIKQINLSIFVFIYFGILLAVLLKKVLFMKIKSGFFYSVVLMLFWRFLQNGSCGFDRIGVNNIVRLGVSIVFFRLLNAHSFLNFGQGIEVFIGVDKLSLDVLVMDKFLDVIE